MTSDGPFLENYLPYLLRQADQVLSAPFYSILNVEGVARSEWRVLAVLHELGPLTVVELAEASLSPQPTVTHAVGRLEQRGLVSRSPGKTDKRQRVITITDDGASLTNRLQHQAKELERRLLADTGDLSNLFDQLRALINTINQSTRATASATTPPQ